MHTKLLLPLLAVALPLFPSVASAAPRLLISDQLAGSVLEFTGGGEVTVFATGLSEPAGLCVGPGNDVYVAEFGTGEITIISEGGDMTDQPAFADTSASKEVSLLPVGLWCNDDVVLVTDFQGAVANVAIGGPDPFAWQPYAFWPGEFNPFPLDIVQSASGNVFVSSAAGIYRGDLGVAMDAPPIVTGHPFVSLEAVGDTLISGVANGPRIYDVSAAGDVADAQPWATLPGDDSVFALLQAGSQTFAASGTAIYDVTDGGDLSDASPFATGLSADLLYQAMIQWNCGSDADCSDGDACNGAERCEENTCLAAKAPLACDDEDVCTSDACDPDSGCTHDSIPGCCASDLDCTLEEICDENANTCVPAFSPTTGDPDPSGGGESTSGGDTGVGESAGESGESDTSGDEPSTSGSDGGASSGASEGDTDDAGAEGRSSGCTVGGRAGLPWWLVLGVLAIARRRAQGSSSAR